MYAFVKALNSEEALSKVTEELLHQNIEVNKVEFISPYDMKTEWETEEQTNSFRLLYENAQSSDDVLFDTFYAYEAEE